MARLRLAEVHEATGIVKREWSGDGYGSDIVAPAVSAGHVWVPLGVDVEYGTLKGQQYDGATFAPVVVDAPKTITPRTKARSPFAKRSAR